MRALTTTLTVALLAVLFVVSPAHAGGALSPFSANLYNYTPNDPGSAGGGVFFSGQDTTTTIRCFEIRWNTQADGNGSVPTGLDTTGADFIFGFPNNVLPTYTGWSTSSSTNGRMRLTKAAGGIPTSGIDRNLYFFNVKNGSVANTTYYVLYRTYTDVNCSAANVVDYGVAAYQYTDGATVSTTVDPSFAFTVTPNASACSLQSASGYVAPSSASAMDLGRINSTNVGSSSHSLSTTTNARLGSKVYVRGAQSSNNLRAGTVQPFADSASAPTAGTATFGYTVSDTNSANGTWKALNGSNAQVASSGTGGFTGQCIGFSAAAASATPAGTYSATVFYTAVPFF